MALAPLLETSIRQMEADGIALAFPADFGDLLHLNELALAITTQTRSPYYEAVLNPEKQVGPYRLRRLTLAAIEFLESRARSWLDTRDLVQQSYFYLLAYGRDPGTFRLVENRAQWLLKIKHFRSACPLTQRQIDDALEDFLAIERVVTEEVKTEAEKRRKRQERGDPDLGWLLEMLTSNYGHTPHYWLAEADMATIRLLKHEHDKREWERLRCEAGAGASDPNDPQLAAIRRYRDAEADFLSRKKVTA